MNIVDVIKKNYIWILLTIFIIGFITLTILNSADKAKDNKIKNKEVEIKVLEYKIKELSKENKIYMDSIKVLKEIEDSLVAVQDGVVVERIIIKKEYEVNIKNINSLSVTEIDSILTNRYLPYNKGN